MGKNDHAEEDDGCITATGPITVTESGTITLGELESEAEKSVSIKMEISGRLLERFERVKVRSGIEASTEAIRHCITLAHRHYLEELS
jgi:hypothetical protein